MMYRLIWHMCTYTYNVYVWAAVVLKQSLKCVFKRCVYIFVFKRFLDADQPTSDDIELQAYRQVKAKREAILYFLNLNAYTD